MKYWIFWRWLLRLPLHVKALEANGTDTTCLKALTVFYMVNEIIFYHLKVHIYSKVTLKA